MVQEIIVETAKRICAQSLSPVVRYRLLRDVLQRPSHDPELHQAKKALNDSKWVQQLAPALLPHPVSLR